MARRSVFVTSALLACALGALGWNAQRKGPHEAISTTHVAKVTTVAKAPPRAEEARAPRLAYRIVADHVASLDGKPAASMNLSGTWTTTRRRDGKTEVELSPSRLDAVGDTPPPAREVAEPFVLASREGVLTEIGHPVSMSGSARDLVTSVATLVQLSMRDGDAWTVEEEDLMGRYEARYARSGNTIAKTRGRQTMTRTPKGLVEARGEAMRAVESSTFEVDDKGVVSANIRVEQRSNAGKGLAAVEVVMTAKLTRVDESEVPSTFASLPTEAIRSHVDRRAIAQKQRASFADGARADDLVAQARSTAVDDPARNQVRRRLTAVVDLDPRAASDVANAVRERPEDRDAVRLLVGALSSAHAPEATNELSGLLASPLPEETMSAVLTGLALARTPTSESAAALTRSLDTPLAGQAALALGAEARGLGQDPAASAAIAELLARYEQARSADEKRTLLLALANTGSRDVLDVMRDALRGPDFELARAAAYGLRAIPGDDVDDLLHALIASASPYVVEAVQAVAFRDPSLWRPRLVEAQTHYEGVESVSNAIRAVLTQWKNLTIAAAP